MKQVLLLTAVCVLCSQGVSSADVISCWNLNDAGDATADLVGSNPGTMYGARVTTDTWEGAGAFQAVGSKDYFGTQSANGFSVSQGTYIFSYKKDGTVSDWKDLLGTNLKKANTSYPLRLEHTSAGKLRLYVQSGTSVSGDYNASSTLFDGSWHTVTLTYADGDKIKVYIDGSLVLESTANYVASEYTLKTYFAVGNVYPWLGEAKSAAGRYDRVLVLDNAATAAELPTYLDPSYVPEPTIMGLLLLGSIGFLRKRSNR